MLDLANYMDDRVFEVSGVCAIFYILQYVYYQLTIHSGALVININKRDAAGVDGDIPFIETSTNINKFG